MSIVALGLIARLALASTSATSSQQDPAVFHAAVGEICPGNYLVIDSERAEPPPFDPDAKDAHELRSGASTEAWRDLIGRNREDQKLVLSDICPGARVTTHEEIEAAFADPSSPEAAGFERPWVGFYRAFPGAWGCVRLSVPGYSRDGKLAVVYLEVMRGGTAGYAEFVWLTKKGGKWAVTKRNGLWVA